MRWRLKWPIGCIGLLAITVVLAVFAVCFLRYTVLDPQRYHDLLEQELEQRLGFAVKMGALDYQFPDYLEAGGMQAEVRGSSGALQALRARRVRVEADLAELLHGRLALRRLVFVDLQATFDVGRRGTAGSASGLPPHLGLPEAAAIVGGTVTLLNIPGMPTGQQVVLTGIRATLDRSPSDLRGLRIHGELDAPVVGKTLYEVVLDSKAGRLLVDASAPCVRLGREHYALLPDSLRVHCERTQLTGEMAVDVDASLEIATKRLEVTACRVRTSDLALRVPGLALPLSNVSGEMVADGESIVLRGITGALGTASFEVEGYRDVRAKSSHDLWRFRLRDDGTNNPLSAMVQERLGEFVPDLTVSGTLSASGTLMRPDAGSGWLSVSIEGDGLTVGAAGLPTAMAPTRLVADWDGDAVNLLDLSGRVGGGHFKAAGSAPRKTPSRASVDVTLTGLDVAQVLAPFRARLSVLARRDLKLGGQADGVVRIRPGPDSELTGTADFQCTGTETEIAELPHALAIDRVQLRWDAHRLLVESVHATSGQTSFVAKGDLPFDAGSQRRCDVRIDALSAEALISMLPEQGKSFMRKHRTSGSADVTVSLTTGGQSETPDYTVTVTPLPMSFGYLGIPYDVSGITGTIVATPGAVQFVGLKGTVDQSQARFDGRIDVAAGNAPFDLNLVLEHVPFDERVTGLLPPRLCERLTAAESTGTLTQARLRFTRSPDGEFGWTLRTDVADGTVTLPFLRDCVSGIRGTVSWDGEEAVLQDIRAKACDGALRLSGTVRGEDVKLDITAEGVRLGKETITKGFGASTVAAGLLPDGLTDGRIALRTEKGEDGAVGYTFEGVASRYRAAGDGAFSLQDPIGSVRFAGQSSASRLTRLQAAISLEEVDLAGWQFREATGAVLYDHGALSAKEVRALLHGGLVRAAFTRKEPGTAVDLTAQFSDVNVADLSSRLGATNPIPGLGRGHVEASFMPGDRTTLRGDGQLFVEGHNLWQLPALLSVFSVLPGRPTNRIRYIEARFALRGDQADIAMLKLLGDQYAVYGAGKVARDSTVDLGLLIGKRSILQNAVSALPTGPIGELVNKFIRKIESSLWQIQLKGPFREAKPKVIPLRLNTPELAPALREMQEDARRP